MTARVFGNLVIIEGQKSADDSIRSLPLGDPAREKKPHLRWRYRFRLSLNSPLDEVALPRGRGIATLSNRPVLSTLMFLIAQATQNSLDGINGVIGGRGGTFDHNEGELHALRSLLFLF